MAWGTGIWGSGLWGGTTGVYTNLVNVIQIPGIAKQNNYLVNATLNNIAAQPNHLGNEIDIFITNPTNIAGTLVRNMFRYPTDVTDGITLAQNVPIQTYSDYGLLPETMYYYGYFPTNIGNVPLFISCMSTSAYDFAGFIWDNLIPDIYKEKDAAYAAPALVTMPVVADTSSNTTVQFSVASVAGLQNNTVLQLNDNIVVIRQIDTVHNRVTVSPPMINPPNAGDTVIVQGLGWPLRRFIRVFAEQMDYILSRIKGLSKNQDIDFCEDQYISDLAALTGISQLFNSNGTLFDVRARRNQVKAAVNTYKINGTDSAIAQIIQATIGAEYTVLVQDVKDKIMFSNSYNSINNTPRIDNMPNYATPRTWANQGAYGDVLRYTPDSVPGGNNPATIQVTIPLFFNDPSLITIYTNALINMLNAFIPLGTNVKIIWQQSQAQIVSGNFTLNTNPSIM
jgi:hypothetical protein